MDNFEYMDYEEFNNILSFAVSVIEFFKNDYLVIFDFLKGDSPWDLTMMIKHSISYEELDIKKQEMMNNIVNVFLSCVAKPLFETEGDKKIIMAVDQAFFESINRKNVPMDIFMNNEFCTLQLIKYYVRIIKQHEDVNINTNNHFKSDMAAILNIYSELNSKYGLENYVNNGDEIPDDVQDTFADFYEELYREVTKYNSCNFRDNDEISEFINYIYSLAYAYLIKNDKIEQVLNENDFDFKQLVESEENLYTHFYTEGLSSILVFELIDELFHEYGAYYDLRTQIEDTTAQETFKRLDENYNSEDNPDIIINSFELDLKLEYLIESLFLKYDNYNKIYEFLMNDTPMYEDLFKLDLDARFTEYYKEQIIRKIITDVFEYEGYNNHNKNDIENFKNYNDIKNLPYDDYVKIILYFDENYHELFEKYQEYKSSSWNNMYRVKEYIYNTKQLSTIDRIYNYGISRYFMLMLGKITATDSVDYMNKLTTALITPGDKEFKTPEEIQEYKFMIQVMCLKVYEHIILDEVIGIDADLIKKIMETEEDIFNYFVNNYNFQEKVEKIYLRVAKKELTYKDESDIREKITQKSHIKVLKKLNPFYDVENNIK